MENELQVVQVRKKDYELILMLKMKWMSLILLDLALAGLESHDLDRTGKSRS